MTDLSQTITQQGVTSWVYDAQRQTIDFLTTDGNLSAWSVVDQSVTWTMDVGTSASALALTPDGKLLVGNAAVSVSASAATVAGDVVARVDPDTQTADQISIPVGAQSNPATAQVQSIVVSDQGKAFVDQSGVTWGDTTLQSFYADDAQPTPTGLPYPLGTGTPQRLIMGEGGHDLILQDEQYARMTVFNADTMSQIGSADLSGRHVFTGQEESFRGQTAISETAGLAVALTNGGVYVLNLDQGLSTAKDLSSYGLTQDTFPAQNIRAAAFSEGGHALFLWDSIKQQVLAFDTSTWQQVGSFQTSVTDTTINDYGATLPSMNVVDGHLLVLAAGGGMQVIDLDAQMTGGLSIHPYANEVQLVGFGGADSMTGVSGNIFTGAGGDDTITGGSGWNTATYSGDKSDYLVTVNADGTVTVADQRAGSPDGTDSLSHIQSLSFADGTMALGPTTVKDAVALGFASVLRESGTLTSADLPFRSLLLSEGAQGTLTESGAVTAIVQHAAATSSVATLAYQFFTGGTPSAAGMDYLVSPTGPNPDNLNSAYYQAFGLENRYINFASNLGKAGGAGATQFAADYGQLSMSDALTKAYTAIFGSAPSADKVGHLLNDLVPDGLGGTYARVDYFAAYGGDGETGIGTKAAMVGWLLAEAVKADVGTFALANDAYLADVLQHNAAMAVNLIGHYATAAMAYTGP